MIVFDILIARSKRDGTRAETRIGLSAKRTSPFKSAGVSVQSTTGSRGVQISGQRLYRPCSDVQCKAAGYPLHSHLSPSLLLPCVTVCHQVPNALYYRVTCEMCAETFGGLNAESLLLLPDFHQNWYVMTDFSKSFQHPVSWESV